MKGLGLICLLLGCGTDLIIKVHNPNPIVTACEYDYETGDLLDYEKVRRSEIKEGYEECIVIEN